MNRRDFLTGSGALGLATLAACAKPSAPGTPPAPNNTVFLAIAAIPVVADGILAGLSAAGDLTTAAVASLQALVGKIADAASQSETEWSSTAALAAKWQAIIGYWDPLLAEIQALPPTYLVYLQIAVSTIQALLALAPGGPAVVATAKTVRKSAGPTVTEGQVEAFYGKKVSALTAQDVIEGAMRLKRRASAPLAASDHMGGVCGNCGGSRQDPGCFVCRHSLWERA